MEKDYPVSLIYKQLVFKVEAQNFVLRTSVCIKRFSNDFFFKFHIEESKIYHSMIFLYY